MSDETVENPSTMAECVERAHASRSEIEALIATLTEEQLTTPGPEIWSIKDHLAHLEVWSRTLIDTLSGRSRYPRLGVAGYAALVDVGFDVVNEGIFQANRDRSLADVLAGFRGSHQEVLDRLGSMSDADLSRPYASFVPEDRPDAGEAIVNWITGNTWDHDAEHLVWIRQQFNL